MNSNTNHVALPKKTNLNNVNNISKFSIYLIECFLFDNFENIKTIKTSDKILSDKIFLNDKILSDKIFLNAIYKTKIIHSIYKINDFTNNYYFIKIENRFLNTNPVIILFPKIKANFISFKNQLIDEIKNCHYKDIFNILKINKKSNFKLEEINDFQNNNLRFINMTFNLKEILIDNKNKFRNNANINNTNNNNINNSQLISDLYKEVDIFKAKLDGIKLLSKKKEENIIEQTDEIEYLGEVKKENEIQSIDPIEIEGLERIEIEEPIDEIEILAKEREANIAMHIYEMTILGKEKIENKVEPVDEIEIPGIEKQENLMEVVDEINLLGKECDNNNNSIFDLINHIEIFKKKLGFDLDRSDKLMIVIVSSIDQQIINHPFICKNTLQFCALENIIYNEYPQLRENSNSNCFLAKGNIINRFKTMDENNIENMDILTLSTFN